MRSVALALATLWGVTAVALAQESAAVPAPDGQPYVVREGDTLEGLAARYLGSEELWDQIWRANPAIKDPQRVYPGQHIVIPKKVGIAEIEQIARRVDSRPHTAPAWTTAHIGDSLNRRDGLRTYRSSSARLGFTDGSDLTIGEDSLIFVRELRAPVARVSRRSIEIVEGQGDLNLAAPGATVPAARSDIEVVVGSARVASARAADGTGWSRARTSADGGPAQLMVFKGSSQVRSAGAAVMVQEGMGTSVSKGQKPTAPERLLPAPQIAIPSAGASFNYANPRFVWRRVAGANSYVVEVCNDPRCGRLVLRVPGLGQNEWIAEGLPVGEFFWRVTARSSNGLDGYPSEPRQVRVTSLWRRPAAGRPAS